MMSPANFYGIDFTLYSDDGVIIKDIEYKGKVRELTETEAAILKEIVRAGNATKEYFKTHTYAEIFGVNAGSLPPVDVVASKPTTKKTNNAKILLPVLALVAALVLFNK